MMMDGWRPEVGRRVRPERRPQGSCVRLSTSGSTDRARVLPECDEYGALLRAATPLRPWGLGDVCIPNGE